MRYFIDYKNMAQKQQYIECCHCHSTLPIKYSSDEIYEDEEQDLQIIRISESQVYCLRCLQYTLQQQMHQVRNLEERYIYYKQFESSFEEKQYEKKDNKKITQSSTNEEEQMEIINKLRDEEDLLKKDINKLLYNSNMLKNKMLDTQGEEDKFWDSLNKMEKRINKLQEKSLATKFDMINSKSTFQQLAKTSVLHISLDIRIEDNIAYIQNMPLGKKPETIEISWFEVAVGIGHLLLGFNILAFKYQFEYRKIQTMILKGNLSEIILKDKKRILSVHYNKQQEKSFGELLQVLLYQMFYLSEYILEEQNIQYSQQFKMPLLINIHEYKIAQIFVDPSKIDERSRWFNWTKSMRYFLICFKHLLTVSAFHDKYL